MKNLGYLLITAGFLAGSYIAVLQTEEVDWAIAIPFLVVGAIGVALVQLAKRAERSAVDTVQANLQSVDESLARLVSNTAKLDAEKDSIAVGDIRHRIDETFMEDLDTFVSARESISHAFGLQAYADVMSEFATGERYLNRAWSASTDGYIEEVHDYLGRAKRQFASAHAKLQSFESGIVG